MAYEINYNDPRFTKVETEKKQALTENEKLYDNMISQSDKQFQSQIDAAKQWGDTQSKLQQEKTDFAIEQIEQQKDKAEKDYTKEQSGAYVDWQKQSNVYGVNAEQTAALGMANSGYAESSQVRMYTAYQNRIAVAREAHSQAILNYNNSIKDAQLQNNSILAQIAYETLQKQLELNTQKIAAQNQFLLAKSDKKTQLEQLYHQKYQDVLAQINTENALQEQVRQFNANYSLQQQKLAEEQRQFNEQMAWQKAQAAASAARSSSGGGGSSSRSSGGSSGGVSSSKASGGSVSSTKYSNGSNSTAAKDALQYGTFSNGYQPKGISGHGELSKTGNTATVNGQTQNVWKTDDGKQWVWDGKDKQYEEFKTSSAKKPSSGKAGGAALGAASMMIR